MENNNECESFNEKLSISYNNGIRKITGNEQTIPEDFYVPKHILEKRKVAWNKLFTKYSSELPTVELNIMTLEPVEDNDDNNVEENITRLPMRKPMSMVQYWVNTGNQPYIDNNINNVNVAVASDTYSSIIEEELVNSNDNYNLPCNSSPVEHCKTNPECNIQLKLSNLSSSSVDTAAYILANNNTTKKADTLAIMEGSKAIDKESLHDIHAGKSKMMDRHINSSTHGVPNKLYVDILSNSRSVNKCLNDLLALKNECYDKIITESHLNISNNINEKSVGKNLNYTITPEEKIVNSSHMQITNCHLNITNVVNTEKMDKSLNSAIPLEEKIVDTTHVAAEYQSNLFMNTKTVDKSSNPVTLSKEETLNKKLVQNQTQFQLFTRNKSYINNFNKSSKCTSNGRNLNGNSLRKSNLILSMFDSDIDSLTDVVDKSEIKSICENMKQDQTGATKLFKRKKLFRSTESPAELTPVSESNFSDHTVKVSFKYCNHPSLETPKLYKRPSYLTKYKKHSFKSMKQRSLLHSLRLSKVKLARKTKHQNNMNNKDDSKMNEEKSDQLHIFNEVNINNYDNKTGLNLENNSENTKLLENSNDLNTISNNYNLKSFKIVLQKLPNIHNESGIHKNRVNNLSNQNLQQKNEKLYKTHTATVQDDDIYMTFIDDLFETTINKSTNLSIIQKDKSEAVSQYVVASSSDESELVVDFSTINLKQRSVIKNLRNIKPSLNYNETYLDDVSSSSSQQSQLKVNSKTKHKNSNNKELVIFDSSRKVVKLNKHKSRYKLPSSTVLNNCSVEVLTKENIATEKEKKQNNIQNLMPEIESNEQNDTEEHNKTDLLKCKITSDFSKQSENAENLNLQLTNDNENYSTSHSKERRLVIASSSDNQVPVKKKNKLEQTLKRNSYKKNDNTSSFNKGYDKSVLNGESTRHEDAQLLQTNSQASSKSPIKRIQENTKSLKTKIDIDKNKHLGIKVQKMNKIKSHLKNTQENLGDENSSNVFSNTQVNDNISKKSVKIRKLTSITQNGSGTLDASDLENKIINGNKKKNRSSNVDKPGTIQNENNIKDKNKIENKIKINRESKYRSSNNSKRKKINESLLSSDEECIVPLKIKSKDNVSITENAMYQYINLEEFW